MLSLAFGGAYEAARIFRSYRVRQYYRSWPTRSRPSGCGASAYSLPGPPRTIPDGQTRSAAFLQGLQQLGWTDGRNVRIDYRWGAGDADNMRKYAAELVALAPDVILASGTATVAPLLQATRTVPIVFAQVTDPVGAGFVDSLARPGGNATGFLLFEYAISGKWLELLKEIAPRVRRAGGHSRSRPNRRDRPVRRNPVRGAVARGGGEPGQCARRGRDRARHRGLRTLREWRPDRDGERVVGRSSRSDRHAGGTAQTARGLLPTPSSSPVAA